MGQPARPGLSRIVGARQLAIALASLSAFVLGGCGENEPAADATAPTTPRVSWTLVLDYQPNAVHAGLLRAEQAGYFHRAGIDLQILAPSSTSDPLTQVSRGKADLGLADLIDVARRNDRATGAPALQLAGAIVQRPLSGLLVNADSGITQPQQLRGKSIAVTGLPSDEAIVDVLVNADGQAQPKPKLITLGFNGLKALNAGRVDASTAYWPADAVTLDALGTKPRAFALDEFGGPRYPGLVAFSSRAIASAHGPQLDAFQEALSRGTADVVGDPELGRAALKEAYPELDPDLTARQLDRHLPLFGDRSTAGRLGAASLVAFTGFAADSGLTSRRLTLAQLGLRERQ